MSGLVRLGGALAVTVLLVVPVQAQSLKPWRQAMILPKADAGFFLMAAKRGFAEREGLKVEVLEVKDDPIGMKALLSGEVDSYEGVYGAIAAFARGADVKLLGCNWHAAPYVMLARPGVDDERQDAQDPIVMLEARQRVDGDEPEHRPVVLGDDHPGMGRRESLEAREDVDALDGDGVEERVRALGEPDAPDVDLVAIEREEAAANPPTLAGQARVAERQTQAA